MREINNANNFCSVYENSKGGKVISTWFQYNRNPNLGAPKNEIIRSIQLAVRENFLKAETLQVQIMKPQRSASHATSRVKDSDTKQFAERMKTEVIECLAALNLNATIQTVNNSPEVLQFEVQLEPERTVSRWEKLAKQYESEESTCPIGDMTEYF